MLAPTKWCLRYQHVARPSRAVATRAGGRKAGKRAAPPRAPPPSPPQPADAVQRLIRLAQQPGSPPGSATALVGLLVLLACVVDMGSYFAAVACADRVAPLAPQAGSTLHRRPPPQTPSNC